MATSLNRYRLPCVTPITDRGEAGPLRYRPKPLMSVELAVGAVPAEGAGTWYLEGGVVRRGPTIGSEVEGLTNLQA